MMTTTGKEHQKTNNGISFWAFLFSIFIYISIFYMFNLSPLNLINSTKFWFFISNTLIIIIAADFGAFFSSRNPEIYHDNYLKKAAAKSSCFNPSFECYMQKSHEKVICENRDVITPREEIKCVVVTKNDEREIVANNKEMETVTKLEKRGECDGFQEVMKKSDEAKCGRRNSEVGRNLLAENEEKKNGSLQRSLSERYNNNLKNVEEENNEFSGMSVEELNRRVEEFIQRFNRQIRLQAASRKLHN